MHKFGVHKVFCVHKSFLWHAWQGLLALEGELTPILVQMVKSANMNGLLDNDLDSLSSCQQRVKARLQDIMQKDEIFTEEHFDKVNTFSSAENCSGLDRSVCLPDFQFF